MKKLAILANPQQGQEIINKLIEFGGKNTLNLTGDASEINHYYYINLNDVIRVVRIDEENKDCFKCFTFEAFNARYPFKVNDMICFKNSYNNTLEEGVISNVIWFPMFGEVVYHVNNSVVPIFLCDIISKAEAPKEPTSSLKKTQMDIVTYLTEKAIRNTSNALEIEEYLASHNLYLPNEIVINYTDGITSEDFQKWYQSKYPTTYEECCKVLDIDCDESFCCGYNNHNLNTLQTLLICKDAYWAIDDNWSPDWNKQDIKHCVKVTGYEIKRFQTNNEYHMFAFPNREACDEFINNFGALITKCVHLL